MSLLIIGGVGYGSLLGLMTMFQRQMVFLPDASTPWLGLLPRMEGAGPLPADTADNLTITGFYVPPRDGRPVIVLFHGNAGNIGNRLDKATLLTSGGYGVLLAGYRGYGGNPGRPTEEGLYADARAQLDALAERGIEGDRLVLWGESLGTGVAVQMASERPVRALILEAPYTSLPDVASFHYPIVPASWLMMDRFDSLAKIGAIHRPILHVHGTRDSIVPKRLGDRLMDAAPGPVTRAAMEGADHNDLFLRGAGRHVIDFLESLPPAGP